MNFSKCGASTTPRAGLRRAAREDAGLSLEEVARALPGKRWGLLSAAQRKNRETYIARIERAGTPCEKMARRLAGLYDCSFYLFILEAPSQGASQGTKNKRRHRTRLVRASDTAARTRRVPLFESEVTR